MAPPEERYEEADFPPFSDVDDQGLNFTEYVEYTNALKGTLVPKNLCVGDDAIIAAGYQNWKHYNIVFGMMNWS